MSLIPGGGFATTSLIPFNMVPAPSVATVPVTPAPTPTTVDGSLTAGWIVSRTRELLQLLRTSPSGGVLQYRDGFADDAGTPEELAGQISILTGLNESLARLSQTRVRTEPVRVNVLAGAGTALLPASVIGVTEPVTWGGTPLYLTDHRKARLRTNNYLTDLGVPTHYIAEGRSITLIPVPRIAGLLSVNCTLSLPRLRLRADTCPYIPQAYQDYLPYCAAVVLAIIDANDDDSMKRLAKYEAMSGEVFEGLLRLHGEPVGNSMKLEPRL